MSSLFSRLPKPKNNSNLASSFSHADENVNNETISAGVGVNGVKQPPPAYGKRKGFIPRNPEDFGDGGAYPECHIAQYPLGMGLNRSEDVSKSNAAAVYQNNESRIVPLQVDGQGKVRYDAIVRQGLPSDRIVHSRFSDLIPKDVTESTFVDLPSDEQVAETTARTKAALEKIVQTKIQAINPKSQLQDSAMAAASDPSGANIIRYTPNATFANPEAMVKERIIRLIDMPEDPLEPSRSKHKRLPPPPPSPPAPVMHSPPRKVSAEEQRAWKIPPCVSNWKNPKGFTIPLDKRLAADGRGLQEVVVNDNFAKLSESLYLADRHAREEIEKRAALEKKLADNEKRVKEEEMRRLAMEAREKRAQLAQELNNTQQQVSVADRDISTSIEPEREIYSNTGDSDDIREREKLRRERMKERERELRLNRMGQDTKNKVLSKMQDRDISEKIALGIAQPTYSKEMMYDQRLFNQSQGVTSGFGDEEAYDLYDKPLFTGTSASAIYRPRKNLMENEGGSGGGIEDEDDGGEHAGDRERVKSILAHGRPNKGFTGAKDAPERDGPVQFERDYSNSGGSGKSHSSQSQVSSKTENDPFGLDAFLTEASGRGKKAMQQIGKSNTMSLNSGSSDLLNTGSDSYNNRTMKRARHDSDDEDD